MEKKIFRVIRCNKIQDAGNFGITTLAKWNKGNKKPERYLETLEEAKFNKNSLERADRISYVIFNIATGQRID